MVDGSNPRPNLQAENHSPEVADLSTLKSVLSGTRTLDNDYE